MKETVGLTENIVKIMQITANLDETSLVGQPGGPNRSVVTERRNSVARHNAYLLEPFRMKWSRVNKDAGFNQEKTPCP